MVGVGSVIFVIMLPALCEEQFLALVHLNVQWTLMTACQVSVQQSDFVVATSSIHNSDGSHSFVSRTVLECELRGINYLTGFRNMWEEMKLWLEQTVRV